MLKRTSLLFGAYVVLAVLVYSTERLFACTCSPPSTVSEEFSASDAVFHATVVAHDRSAFHSERWIHFRVHDSWKGVNAGQVCVRTPVDSAGCGLIGAGRSPGLELLVYASIYRSAVYTHSCRRTGITVDGALGDIPILANLGFVPLALDGPEIGNFDGDGLLELTDYAYTAQCVTGPYGAADGSIDLDSGPCCTIADADADLDIDLRDFSRFQRANDGD